jgi:hypothetical protein
MLLTLSFFASRDIAEAFRKESAPEQSLEGLATTIRRVFRTPSLSVLASADRLPLCSPTAGPRNTRKAAASRPAETSRVRAAAGGSTRNAAEPHPAPRLMLSRLKLGRRPRVRYTRIHRGAS